MVLTSYHLGEFLFVLKKTSLTNFKKYLEQVRNFFDFEIPDDHLLIEMIQSIPEIVISNKEEVYIEYQRGDYQLRSI